MNTNEIFNQMLSSYDITTELQKRNAIFEVNQQIILSGLYNGGFFNEAAFYGGTCLRIFHGLKCGFSDTGMLNRCSQLVGGDKDMVKVFKYTG